MAAHPQNKHGKHQHRLDQFGMTEAQVRERFSFYDQQEWLSQESG